MSIEIVFSMFKSIQFVLFSVKLHIYHASLMLLVAPRWCGGSEQPLDSQMPWAGSVLFILINFMSFFLGSGDSASPLRRKRRSGWCDSPWSHRLPTQPSLQTHCQAFSHAPCKQPGNGMQWSQFSPSHPGLHLKGNRKEKKFKMKAIWNYLYTNPHIAFCSNVLKTPKASRRLKL